MLEKHQNLNERNTIPEDIQKSLINLGIDLEDFKGDVLDIGAGDAEIFKFIKEKTDARIVGVDISVSDDLKDEIIIADVRNLPFPNDSFDISFAYASIPNVFIDYYDFKNHEKGINKIYNSIKDSFNEIIRTLKPGGNAYIAPISVAELYDSEKAKKFALEKVIQEIREENKNIKISFDFIETITDEYSKESRDYYRLIIHKIPNPEY